MSRKRYTEAEKSVVLERFAASGMSAREFCVREGVNYQNLQRWRRNEVGKEDAACATSGKEHARESGGAVFLEFDLKRPVRQQPDIELELGAGIVLRIWNQNVAR